MKQPEQPIQNYITLSRKLFEHPFWLEKREFSKHEAWLDLIQSARYDLTEAKRLIDRQMVSWNRGELPASLRFLSERWGWSKNKVSNFLMLLENEKMISRFTFSGTAQTIIKLCNYDSYNIRNKNSGHLRDSLGTAEGQERDKTNKENTVNKENIVSANALAPKPIYSDKQIAAFERKKSFQNSLSEFKEKYSREMLLEFSTYWGELNTSKTKMKFEMEKTWELSLRLSKWAINQQKFDFKKPAAAELNTDAYKEQRRREEEEYHRNLNSN